MDEPSLTTTASAKRDGPGYPDSRGSEEMDPPASVTSPTWQHILRMPGQDGNSPYSKGRGLINEIDGGGGCKN